MTSLVMIDHAVQTTNAKQPIIISSGSITLKIINPTISFDFDKKTLLDAGDFSSY
jgi:hypothetical protein